MSEIDVVNHLSGDHEEDEADENPCNEGVLHSVSQDFLLRSTKNTYGQVTVFVSRNVAETQDVELRLTATTSRIDWKQDRP